MLGNNHMFFFFFVYIILFWAKQIKLLTYRLKLVFSIMSNIVAKYKPKINESYIMIFLERRMGMDPTQTNKEARQKLVNVKQRQYCMQDRLGIPGNKFKLRHWFIQPYALYSEVKTYKLFFRLNNIHLFNISLNSGLKIINQSIDSYQLAFFDSVVETYGY